jgi:hypothetical protein
MRHEPDCAPETAARIQVSDYWSLDADPHTVAGLAHSWRAFAAAATRARAEFAADTTQLLGGWSGADADAFRPYDAWQRRALETAAAQAPRIAEAMDEAAGLLRAGQVRLDEAWREIASAVPADRGGGGVLFSTADRAQSELVEDAVVRASQLRQRLDAELDMVTYRMHVARERMLGESAPAWLAEERGPGGFSSASDAARVIVDGDTVIVNGTEGADNISITVDPVSGERIVTVDGVSRRVPAGARLVVRGGGGDDRVSVAAGASDGVSILGGAGNDTLTGGDGPDTLYGLWGDDTISGGAGDDTGYGGSGRDYLDGGTGNDSLDGGSGDDTLYGLAGSDDLHGADGNDYLDGGTGNDSLDGDSGNDALIGGRGDDQVRGQGGDDHLYLADGSDTGSGGSGDDTAYARPDQSAALANAVEHTVAVHPVEVPGVITVQGSPEFAARVDSDLDALRASPDGAAMFATLQAGQGVAALRDGELFAGPGAVTLTIRETTDANDYARQDGTTYGVLYNPGFQSIADGPPIAALYHEFAHIDDYMWGTSAAGSYTGADNLGVPNSEREAVGLPIDDDGQAATPDRVDPAHPYVLTENGLRTELGVQLRPAY